jgi:hypothetical protein
MYCFMVFDHMCTAMYFILSQVCYNCTNLYSHNSLQSIVRKLSTTENPYPCRTLRTNTFLYFSNINNFSKLLLLSGDL